MAIADQALRFLQRLVDAVRRTPGPRLLLLPATLGVIAVAGCAENKAQHDIEGSRMHAEPRRAHVETHRVRVAAHVRRHDQTTPLRPLDPALLTPQPEPDCELGGPDPKTVDPDQWARLKLDYQRQCFQKAEQATRQRLALLQQAVDVMRRGP
jgi:hypothetical protein